MCETYFNSMVLKPFYISIYGNPSGNPSGNRVQGHSTTKNSIVQQAPVVDPGLSQLFIYLRDILLPESSYELIIPPI